MSSSYSWWYPSEEPRIGLRFTHSLKKRLPIASNCLTASILVMQNLSEFLGQGRNHFERIPDDAVRGDLEDGRVRILVDGHDDLRGRHARQMLDRAGDGDRDIEVRRHG